jgi:hypothetical protein
LSYEAQGHRKHTLIQSIHGQDVGFKNIKIISLSCEQLGLIFLYF